MALFYVTVTGYPQVEIYGGLTAATNYIGTQIGAAYTAWRALSADDKARTLIAATRYLDSLEWIGERNAFDGTTLAWPRSDVYADDGETLLTNAQQLAVISQATFELAALLAEDPDALAGPVAGTAPAISSVSGGGASVSYFEPGTPIEPTTLPTVVDRLLGRWLTGSAAIDDSASIGSYGKSGDSVSGFSATGDYNRTRPF